MEFACKLHGKGLKKDFPGNKEGIVLSRTSGGLGEPKVEVKGGDKGDFRRLDQDGISLTSSTNSPFCCNMLACFKFKLL